jgi:FixJ family two-component response regulator
LSKQPLIAIVDDDESHRRATANIVESLGYDAVGFASAEAFLNWDRVRETDCLISDVQMPGMNGLELQSRLTARGHRVPVVFVTAFPDKKTRGRAIATGAVGYLDKPFSERGLISCLNEALAARGA